MQLKSTAIEPVTGADGRLRLVGEVSYDDRASELYWYEVPEEYAGFVTTNGNPWLLSLLPLAASLGQPLRIDLAVDRLLYENAHELLHVWKCWYPALSVVPIEAEVTDERRSTPYRRTAVCASGGVDSLFSILNHEDSPKNSRSIVDDLLHVRGLNIPLENVDASRRIILRLGRLARQLNKELVCAATNLRNTRLSEILYGHLWHGCALASVALVLEDRYETLLIPSTYTYKVNDLFPWGSHPVTDHLLSTRTLRVVHDGAGHARVDKIGHIASSDVAMNTLHVCNASKSDANCCECAKCLYTMMTLEMFAALPRCSTFPQKTIDLRKVANLHIAEDDRAFLLQVDTLALTNGRNDISRAIRKCLNSSARSRWLRQLEGQLRASRYRALVPRPVRKTMKQILKRMI